MKDLKVKDTVQVETDQLFEEISSKVGAAKNNCSVWRTHQDKWHRLRMRIKKEKDFPFEGCANLRLPTIETKLRKLKSNIVKVIFGQRPVVSVRPSPTGNMRVAKKVEKFLDHLIMDVMNTQSKGIIGIDQTCEKGFYLLKPYWRREITTRTETYSLDDISISEAMWLYDPERTADEIKGQLAQRFDVDLNDLVFDDNAAELDRVVNEVLSGKLEIKYSFKDVLYNAPDIALANPEKVYVPAESTWYPQDARMITHEFYLPYDTVKRNVEFKGWSKSALSKIDYLKSIDRSNVVEGTKDTREGINRLANPSQLVKIWETYMYYDLNNDGYQEKCVFTFAPEFGVTFRKVTLPFNNGKWPFIKLVNELTDDRWFSHRGIPDLIADLVREIDTQHNQKLDSQTLRNAPMGSYRAGVVNPNLIKFTPGQMIPRHDPDDFILMNNTNLNTEFSYKDEQMILESKIEELLGQVDFTLQSMINKREPRTAFEVSQQTQNMQTVFSLDASLYIEAFSELFSYIWDLWCQYGDDETEFSYFGQNGWEKIKLTKEEIQGKYKIVVRGNDQNFSPQVRMQKAQLLMQATMNPVALQMGVVQPANIYNAYKQFYQELDIEGWEQYISMPSPQPQIEMGMENLTPAEQAQIKARHGIQPDIQGMMMEKQQELEKETKK